MKFEQMPHTGWNLYVGEGLVLEFTRDSHGWKFWTLAARDGGRVQGSGAHGERVPDSMRAVLDDLAVNPRPHGSESSQDVS